MKVNRASLKQQLQIAEALQTCVTKTPNGGCYYHEDSLDDGEIGKQLGVSKFSVQHVRRELFGTLHSGRPSSKIPLEIHELQHAISRIEVTLDSIERWAIGRGYNTPAGRLNNHKRNGSS